jgi:hypothetical protein
VRVDPVAARDVAAAYADAPNKRAPLAAAAYAQLVTESDQLFGHLTAPGRPERVHIAFTTCAAPYVDAHELISSVRHDRLLEVTTVAATPDRHHPVMGGGLGGAYDRFRGVHDVLGHARVGLGFDRDSEFAVWRSTRGFTACSPAGRSPPSCTASTASCGPPVNWPSPRRSSSTRGSCADRSPQPSVQVPVQQHKGQFPVQQHTRMAHH